MVARPCQRCLQKGLADACRDGSRKLLKYLLDDAKHPACAQPVPPCVPSLPSHSAAQPPPRTSTVPTSTLSSMDFPKVSSSTAGAVMIPQYVDATMLPHNVFPSIYISSPTISAKYTMSQPRNSVDLTCLGKVPPTAVPGLSETNLSESDSRSDSNDCPPSQGSTSFCHDTGKSSLREPVPWDYNKSHRQLLDDAENR
jgi:hypothetical protein